MNQKNQEEWEKDFDGWYVSLVDKDVLEYQKVFIRGLLSKAKSEAKKEIEEWVKKNWQLGEEISTDCANEDSVMGMEFIKVDDLIKFIENL